MGETLAYIIILSLPALSGAFLWRTHTRRGRDAGGERTWRGIVAINLLVFDFLASSVFAGMESYYRFLHDTTDSFNFTLTSQRWFRRHYHLNASGLRDSIDYRTAIAPGKRRISFLGDSFTAGHGVRNVEDRFANLIRNAHPDWEVHVLAELGHDTGDELKSLRSRVEHGYQLDRVVLVYCLNDISDLGPGWWAARTRLEIEKERLSWFVRNSYFANLLYYRLAARQDPEVAGYYQSVRGAYDGSEWPEQVERLRALHAVVERAGGRLLVVTFPFLHALGPQYEYRPVHERLARFWKEENVLHLDLLPVFEERAPEDIMVGRFDAHPNERAHALAAETIGRFLTAEIAPAHAAR